VRSAGAPAERLVRRKPTGRGLPNKSGDLAPGARMRAAPHGWLSDGETRVRRFEARLELYVVGSGDRGPRRRHDHQRSTTCSTWAARWSPDTDRRGLGFFTSTITAPSPRGTKGVAPLRAAPLVVTEYGALTRISKWKPSRALARRRPMAGAVSAEDGTIGRSATARDSRRAQVTTLGHYRQVEGREVLRPSRRRAPPGCGLARRNAASFPTMAALDGGHVVAELERPIDHAQPFPGLAGPADSEP
jgi:hypothetical protein